MKEILKNRLVIILLSVISITELITSGSLNDSIYLWIGYGIYKLIVFTFSD